MKFQVAYQSKCHFLKLLIAKFGAIVLVILQKMPFIKKIDNFEAKKQTKSWFFQWKSDKKTN